MNDRLMTAAELAEFLAVDPDVVYRSARLRAIARPMNLGDSTRRPRLRWLESDVLELFPREGSSEAGRDPAAGDAAAGAGSPSSSPAAARTRRRALPDDQLISLDRPIRGRSS